MFSIKKGYPKPEDFKAPHLYNILAYLDHNTMLNSDGDFKAIMREKFNIERPLSRYYRYGL